MEAIFSNTNISKISPPHTFSLLKVTEGCISPKQRYKWRKRKAWIRRPQALTQAKDKENSQNPEGKSQAKPGWQKWRATV